MNLKLVRQSSAGALVHPVRLKRPEVVNAFEDQARSLRHV